MNSMDDKSFGWVLKAEGGYVWDKDDHGGETNLGITIATFNKAKQNKVITSTTIKLLTREDARKIYDAYYWRPSHASEMLFPISLIHFDCAVNCGIKGATRQVRRAVNKLKTRTVDVDAPMCPELIEVINAQSQSAMTKAYFDARLDFYKSLHQDKFINGWTNRLKNLAKFIGFKW